MTSMHTSRIESGWFVAFLVAAACSGPRIASPRPSTAAGTRIELSPGEVISGDPVQITLRGFPPDGVVDVVAERLVHHR